MILVDLALSRRLERTEGNACREFVEAKARLQPDSGVAWQQIGCGNAVFDGVDSPITQCFGLGVNEPLTAATLDAVEAFFYQRGAHTDLEISPLAGLDALNLLCQRGYHPIEISSVLCRPVSAQPLTGAAITVQTNDDPNIWAQVSTEGWAAEMPDLRPFLENMGLIQAHRTNSVSFLAYHEGTPAAAGSLSLCEGVAMFSGAATIPAYRRMGLQAALLQARLNHAHQQGYDLAMMVAEAGSGSQRNAQRQGFSIAYTRIKWRRERPEA